MTEIQDYPSRMGDPASRRFETFSYLPPMDAGQIRKQVAYMVERGWNCAIEHVEPSYPEGFAAIRHRRPDCARLHELTHYRPRHGLDAIIEGVVAARLRR